MLPWSAPATHSKPVTYPNALEHNTSEGSHTLLDPDETAGTNSSRPQTAPPEVDQSLCSRFRHSGWMRRRKRVYAAMAKVTDSKARLRRFAECGAQAWVEYQRNSTFDVTYPKTQSGRPPVPEFRTEPARIRVRANHCRDRFCIPCAAARGRLVSNALMDLLGNEPARFITLTVRHHDAPLTEQIDRLYKCYKRLRQRKLWTRHVYAAAATLEVKRSKDEKHWHPHLHVLAKGRYVPHADLKAEWHQITGDSYIVDIRMIKQREKAVSYLTKYVSKPGVHQYDRDPEAMIEAMQSLKGRRMILLTGDWRNLKVPPPDQTDQWHHVSSLSHLLKQAMEGDANARFILAQLRRKNRWWEKPNGPEP